MTTQFTREQRNILNALSGKLYGATSRWQKMLKNKSYWIPTGETEKVENTNYFIKGRKGRTLMRVNTAVGQGLLKQEEGKEHPDKFETVRQVLRAPTYEELRETLEHMVDSKAVSLLMSRGSPEDVRFVYAYRLAKGDLRYSFGLQKTLNVPEEVKNDPEKVQTAMVDAQVEYDKELDELLKMIDDEKLTERIKDAVVDAKTFAKMGGFEALDFAADVVFVLKNESAEEQYVQIMEEAESLLSA